MTYVLRLDGEPRMQAAAGILATYPDHLGALYAALDWLGEPPVQITLTNGQRTLIVQAVKE